MAHNQRIFYACQAVAIAPRGTGTLGASHVVYGLQSVGMSSTFSLDQVFEMVSLLFMKTLKKLPISK